MYNVSVMTRWRIQISGMHCDGCVRSVCTALESIDGVDQATVSLDDQLALVSTTARLDPETIHSAIVTSGFQLEQLTRDDQVLPQRAPSSLTGTEALPGESSRSLIHI